MAVRIFVFFIRISLLWLPMIVFGQNEKVPLYNGTYVSADISGVGSKVLGGDFLQTEIGVDVNLKRRFFPIVEVGYGTTNTQGEKGTRYKSNAPFFRVGMNYNFMHKKNSENHWYVGFRYAASSFSYDVENDTKEGNSELIDPIWGGSLPYRHLGMKASMSWFELLGGVRVQVYKNFMMGWSLRMKSRLSASTGEYGDPWYVPGFGTYDSSQLGITYSIIYKLPL